MWHGDFREFPLLAADFRSALSAVFLGRVTFAEKSEPITKTGPARLIFRCANRAGTDRPGGVGKSAFLSAFPVPLNLRERGYDFDSFGENLRRFSNFTLVRQKV
jgi:hypothetical protein